jgi:hypothetical protein
MKLKLICCGMISREMSRAVSEARNEVETVFLPAALHTQGPRALREAVQGVIDDTTNCDAVLIGFGLCGNGLDGIRAGATPLVVPRAHDCITLLMGSRRRFAEYFDSHPGAYFLSTGWVEEGLDAEPAGAAHATLTELIQKYGDENGRYIYETLHQYETRYRLLTFIENGLEGDIPCAAAAREEAARRGWRFEQIRGDLGLFRKLVDGEWDAADFVVVPPGGRLVARHDEGILGVEP